MTRPQCVRSRAVRLNNLSLIRHFGNPNETILPFLGSHIPHCERDSEDLLKKTRYLWQDTVEDLFTSKEITVETLEKAWVLIATQNKPKPPPELYPKPVVVAVPPPKKDYDQYIDDVDADTLAPKAAKQTSDAPVDEEFDIEHDTFDTFADVVKTYPYVKIYDHKLYGKILAVGQLSGRNKQEHLVYKGCRLDDNSFGKIGCIAEYERKGVRDSTYKIRVLKLRETHALKFWVNVDDPSRPKGLRDLEEMYRYFKVSPAGIQEIDSLAYSALKNSLQAA